MKTEQPILITSVTAQAETDPFLFVGFDGAALNSAGAKALGVSNELTVIGEQLPVTVSGIALVLSGDAVSAGDPVTSDANAKAVTADDFSVTIPADSTNVTSDAAQPDLVLAGSVLPQAINGYALDEATGADEVIRVLLK